MYWMAIIEYFFLLGWFSLADYFFLPGDPRRCERDEFNEWERWSCQGRDEGGSR